MAGRRPKPNRLKALEGNPGKRALNASEPQPEGKAICPKHLTSGARWEWRRVSQELERLGLLTSVDRAALAAYCQCYARWIQAEKEISKRGLLIVIEEQDDDGKWHITQSVKNPACTIQKDMLQQMRSYLTEFGMTPSSRSRISTGADKEQSLRDILEAEACPSTPVKPN